MNGVIDIGNTRVKWGLFEEESLVEQGWINFGEWEQLEALQKHYEVRSWLLSSVREIPALPFPVEILTEKTPLPVTNLYASPSTLGRDRIAAVCGALALFPGKNCLVIDAGTCITYDFLDETGAYHGGNITPGLQMRLDAMHRFTGKLPDLKWKDTDLFYGKDTESCLLSGINEGVLGEARHLIQHYQEYFGSLQVIVCGGDALFFEKRLKMNIFAAPYLVLLGLNKILRHRNA